MKYFVMEVEVEYLNYYFVMKCFVMEVEVEYLNYYFVTEMEECLN